MLRRWTLENFKPIRGRLDLPVAPLTVLAGLNSSGKSSFLQSILLVAQTLANQRMDEPLVLNGPLVQLGTFQDVCNDRAGEQRIHIGFSVEGHDERRSPSRSQSRDGDKNTLGESRLVTSLDAQFEGVVAMGDKTASIMATRAVLKDVRLAVSSPAVDVSDGAAAATVVARKATPAQEDEILAGISESAPHPIPYPRGHNYLATVGGTALSAGQTMAFVRWAHFVPSAYFTRKISRSAANQSYIKNLFDRELPRSDTRTLDSIQLTSILGVLSFASGTLRPEVARRIKRLESDHSLAPFQGSTAKDLAQWALGIPRDRIVGATLGEVLADALLAADPPDLADVLGEGLERATSAHLEAANLQVFTTFTGAIRYLGPLRAEPLAVQGFSPTGQPDDVGPRGEYAASVYAANRHQLIRFFDPTSQEVRTAALEDAMDLWLRHLGVADHVSAREAAAPGVSWMVRSAPENRERPLSAVGVGVSQVLPILVAGLLSPEGAILVMEQPELHLHERPQARLGDFFYGLTRVGKQVFVETHSAVLIGQLRYRMVKSGQEARDAIAIYFVSQDEQGDAKFEPIRISKRGAIENWPDGFFDESFRQEDLITAEGLRAGGGKRGNA